MLPQNHGCFKLLDIRSSLCCFTQH